MSSRLTLKILLFITDSCKKKLFKYLFPFYRRLLFKQCVWVGVFVFVNHLNVCVDVGALRLLVTSNAGHYLGFLRLLVTPCSPVCQFCVPE